MIGLSFFRLHLEMSKSRFPNMAPAARGRERGQFAKAVLRRNLFQFRAMWCRTSQGFLATLLVAALWAASSAVSGAVTAESRSFRQIDCVTATSACIEGAVTFVTGAVRSTPDARSLVAREGGAVLGKLALGFASGRLQCWRFEVATGMRAT